MHGKWKRSHISTNNILHKTIIAICFCPMCFDSIYLLMHLYSCKIQLLISDKLFVIHSLNDYEKRFDYEFYQPAEKFLSNAKTRLFIINISHISIHSYLFLHHAKTILSHKELSKAFMIVY